MAENHDQLLLIDLSSILHPIFHMSASDPNPNATSIATVARVRALATAHPHAAVCADSGKSIRKEWDNNYKGNRPPSDAALQHQMTLAIETLKGDGFPVWAVPGYEADDLIAAGVKRALALADITVVIVSSDKDLLQLVGPRVTAKSLRDGSIVDEAAVVAKFGVKPEQVRDYLSLVGDTSDNIIGSKGIGPKKAADLLATFGSIDALYAAIDKNEAKLQPAVLASLTEFRPRSAMVRKLVTLMDDVAIPFEEIANERIPKDAAAFGQDVGDVIDQETGELVDDEPFSEPQSQAPAAPAVPSITQAQPSPSVPKGGDIGRSAPIAAAFTGVAAGQPSVPNGADSGQLARVPAAMVVREPEGPAPAEFERMLEPRSMAQAKQLAIDMHAARLFSAFGSPQACLAMVLSGREFGLPAMASLRAFHVIEGVVTMKADLIRAIILKSGKAEYFRPVERTAEKATFVTKRHGDPEMSLTYSTQEGRIAFGFTPDMPEKDKAAREAAWNKSGWGRNSADMCVARAGAKLARMIYPDVTHGLYCLEELD